MSVSIIVAMTLNRVIGKGNELPWHLPDDMKYFKKVTTSQAMFHNIDVIMGRKTWESIPEKYRPLIGRNNWVISRNPGYVAKGATVCGSLEQALLRVDYLGSNETFVIGGSELYKAALPYAAKLYITKILTKDIEGDVFFPETDLWMDWDLMQTTSDHPVDEKHAYPFYCEIYKRNEERNPIKF